MLVVFRKTTRASRQHTLIANTRGNGLTRRASRTFAPIFAAARDFPIEIIRRRLDGRRAEAVYFATKTLLARAPWDLAKLDLAAAMAVADIRLGRSGAHVGRAIGSVMVRHEVRSDGAGDRTAGHHVGKNE